MSQRVGPALEEATLVVARAGEFVERATEIATTTNLVIADVRPHVAQISHEAMEIVMNAAPDVLNHNTETVPRLYRQVRLGARYERSLEMLEYAKSLRPEIE